ncbi:MAG: energy transducer TonB [Oligoflexia bacterium]|nr:energy transducer TonB [Oligoflexia bacterium]
MNKKYFTLSGILSLALCTLVIVGTAFLNELEMSKQNNSGSKKVSFEVKQIKKKRKQNIQKKVVKKKRKPKAPPPAISSSLNGSSFGLDQFEFLGEGVDGLLSDSKDVIMTESTVDQKPIVSFRPQLEYPKRARTKGLEGYVLVNLLVNTNGQVENAKLLEDSPKGIFSDVAINNVKRWQFEPAQYKGKNVKIWVQQRIRFALN